MAASRWVGVTTAAARMPAPASAPKGTASKPPAAMKRVASTVVLAPRPARCSCRASVTPAKNAASAAVSTVSWRAPRSQDSVTVARRRSHLLSADARKTRVGVWSSSCLRLGRVRPGVFPGRKTRVGVYSSSNRRCLARARALELGGGGGADRGGVLLGGGGGTERGGGGVDGGGAVD